MFENVGSKVKGIIKFFFWFSFIVECIAAIVGIVSVCSIFSRWAIDKCIVFSCLIIIGLCISFLVTYIIALFGMCFAQVTLDVEKMSKCICDGDNGSTKVNPDHTVDQAFIVNNANEDSDKQNIQQETSKREDEIPKELKF